MGNTSQVNRPRQPVNAAQIVESMRAQKVQKEAFLALQKTTLADWVKMHIIKPKQGQNALNWACLKAESMSQTHPLSRAQVAEIMQGMINSGDLILLGDGCVVARGNHESNE